ncbi:MAG: hypothetical protein AB2689_03255 [Candidatus Thiodiazotropha taylori]
MNAKLILLTVALFLPGFVSADTSVRFNVDNPQVIEIDRPALYPETIQYNPVSDRFVVGSFREGALYEVSENGDTRQIIDDERLVSSLGFVIDHLRDRVAVATSDIGAALRTYVGGAKRLATVELFRLSTGRHLRSVQLPDLGSDAEHLVNGMTMDDAGNLYVTDSFSPVIYRIDIDGNSDIFLKSERFHGKGINLNGIVFHPDGYLIVVKKSDGRLFKIHLDDPQGFLEIETPEQFVGGDGLLLVDKGALLVVANRALGENTESAFVLESGDGWRSAAVIDRLPLGAVYPTTAVTRARRLYVMHSNLDELIAAPPERRHELSRRATIRQIGEVTKRCCARPLNGRLGGPD